MINKFLICDTDDTTLLCSDALEAYCEEKLGMKSLKRLRDHYSVDKIFDIDYEAAENVCKDFWTSEQFYSLEPMQCALEVLPRLYSKGWRFVAITACIDNPIVKENRLKNLKNAFGFEWSNIHLTHGISKSVYLKEYEPTVWVEDHWHNCQAGGKLGHKSFLINKAYNEIDHEEPLFTRVKDWHDIEALID
jgi:5'(3')-deoxyribonucleotidase